MRLLVPVRGVCNAAVSVVTEASAHNAALIEELRQLRTREDWASTAAAHLVPGGFAPGGKTGPSVGSACGAPRMQSVARRYAPLS